MKISTVMSQVPEQFFELAQQYKVKTDKPHFPMNTLRLFYLILTRDLTGGSEAALDMTNQAVPMISSYIDTANKWSISPDKLLDTLVDPRTKIVDLVEVPALNDKLKQAWEREQLPLYLANKSIVPEHLQGSLTQRFQQLLDNRSVEAIVYSSVVGTIIRKHHPPPTPATYNPLVDTADTIYLTIRLMQQLNDVVDAIVYAKQDLENDKAPLITIVQETINSPEEQVAFYREIIMRLLDRIAHLPLSQPGRSNVHAFGQMLDRVLGGSRVMPGS